MFYLDVSLEETLRRHITRPQVNDFSDDDMRAWYLPHDVLGSECEVVVAESSTFEETVGLIRATSGLRTAPVDTVDRRNARPDRAHTDRSFDDVTMTPRTWTVIERHERTVLAGAGCRVNPLLDNNVRVSVAEQARVDVLCAVEGIEPCDEQEAAHRADVLAWIRGGSDLYRVTKPDVAPKHLVAYFVVILGRTRAGPRGRRCWRVRRRCGKSGMPRCVTVWRSTICVTFPVRACGIG